MKRQMTIAFLAAAVTVTAGIGLAVAVVAPASAESKAPKDAQKIKDALKKLYGKFEFSDTIGRGEVINELHNLATRDKKDPALRYSAWWSEQVVEALYAGDKYLMGTGSTKKVDKLEIDVGTWKVPLFVRGPSSYSKARSSPMIISFLDAKVDAKAWLEKSWAANEDIAKDWIVAAVQDSPQFDATKDPLAPARVLVKLTRIYNVDPNRLFVEGAGGACRTAQIAATLTYPDRLAGLILRNPQESFLNENASLYTTVVVHGPEATEKPLAVLAAAKKAAGEDRGVVIAAPDFATADGMCQPLVDWLKTAKPRSIPASYSWTATIDKDNACPNTWTGSVLIQSPVKRGEPTTLKINLRRDSNTVDLQATNLGDFMVCLNDDMMDLDKEVAIIVNGTPVVKRVLSRDTQLMLSLADEFGEYGRLYSVQQRASAPSAGEAVAAPAPGDKKDGDKKDGEKK